MSMKHPDVILHNGEIVTLDPARPRVEAIALAHDRIVELGSAGQILPAAGSNTRVVDLMGRTLIPALKDHHLHLAGIGFALLNRERQDGLFLDLSSAASGEHMVELVAQRAATLPRGSWIVGSAWSEMPWEQRSPPSLERLSDAVPDHPCFLVRIDSHSALLNRSALGIAAIDESAGDPYGGAILRDSRGALTGMLLERAVEPVLARIPVPDDAMVREAFRLAVRSLAARGYARVCDAGIMHFPGIVAMNAPMDRWLDLLVQLDREEGLPIHVNLMIPAPSGCAERMLSGELSGDLSPNVHVTHLKLFCDGAFGSRGALLLDPYSDDPRMRGVARMSFDEMHDYSRRAVARGLDVAIHAIGDRAVARVLDVYEAILRADPAIAPRRLRLEHFAVSTAADVERAARLGILLVAQPAFVWPMANGRCMEDYRLGDQRVTRTYAWRSLLDAGAAIIGSSDDYTLPPHPLAHFHAAATRRNPDDIPAAGWQPQECLTREESLSLFTRLAEPGGAMRSGRLAVGESAEVTILSANPLTVPDSAILDIEVLAVLRPSMAPGGMELPAGIRPSA
jgi:predicted amidohydrolase YtcJ